jgi:hypothetical protein
MRIMPEMKGLPWKCKSILRGRGTVSPRVFSGVTLGNTPNTDILCSNIEGTRFVHIQVKTFVPRRRTCSVGKKAERDFGENFFWVLCGLPEPNIEVPFVYYVIPSSEMARNVIDAHQRWLSTPGVKGHVHRDNNVRTVHLPPAKSFLDGK